MRIVAAVATLQVAPVLIAAVPFGTTAGVGNTVPPPMRPDLPESIEAYGEALPLGSPSLDEKREVTELVPGVTHTSVTRGVDEGVYTVDVLFTTDHAEARALGRELGHDGYRNRVERVARDVPDDPGSTTPLGWVVRTGSADSATEVETLQDRLEADGHPRGAAQYTAEDGFKTSGPWVVNILQIDPAEFNGTVEPVPANGRIPGLAPVPATSTEHDALAAVNGGFFWVAGEDGVEGQLSGPAMVDGELISGQEQVSPNTEFVDFRSGLLFQPGDEPIATVNSVGTELTVTAGDATAELDGLNRKPLDDELVHLTSAFGDHTGPAAASDPAFGVEVALNGDDEVIAVRHERGGPIPAGGSVLIGVGAGENWLLEHTAVGQVLQVGHTVTTEVGEPLPPTVTGLVNGGPRLVTDGQTDLQARADGFASTESFFHDWSVSRHPRTVAGVEEDGTVFFATIDGRQPGVSVGASIWEAARVALSLDAEHAVNLDGGDSTTMVVEDEVVTDQPLRAIADAILIVPGP